MVVVFDTTNEVSEIALHSQVLIVSLSPISAVLPSHPLLAGADREAGAGEDYADAGG